MRDDPIQNLKIVQLVEKYPHLYDSTLKEYDQKTEVERAWAEIGQELNMPGSIVRDRWRVIRGSYVRYLRQQNARNDGETPKKPYYLSNYMKFVDPFLKPREAYSMLLSGERKRPRRPRQIKSPREQSACMLAVKKHRSSSESSVCPKDEIHDLVDDADNNISIIEQYYDEDQDTAEVMEDKGAEGRDEILYDISQSPSSCHRYTVIRSDPKPEETSTKNAENTEIQWQKVDTEEDTPDLHFFKSLLPEMASLTPAMKNRFKIDVLNSLNNLLYGE
ncbi:uncharacterized protein LOC129795979 [Lutzomyia longipalpis]|uniref:uncharacterized protein LOC129795979 n=1 Tax=Lutzomyia longipalpis TaxID=7200 RepID=UPI0024847228|nr:uncharacterized protein LOC129795979 [Lutzomyia longipalpis]